MHPEKAEALGKLAQVTRELDTAIDELKDVARNPDRNGWPRSVKAIATLPVLGLGAMLVDAAEVVIRRTSDSAWKDKDPPQDMS